MLRKIGRPRGITKARKNIYKAEFEKLILGIESSSMKQRTKDNAYKISYLLFYFGFRISEVSRLKNKDIHTAVYSNIISLGNDTKTKKPREAYISKENSKILQEKFYKELLEPMDYSLISPTKNKRDYYSSASMVKMLNRVIKNILGEQYSTHSFRAGYITTLFRAGVQINVISKVIGHSKEATTMRYISVDESELKKAVLSIPIL